MFQNKYVEKFVFLCVIRQDLTFSVLTVLQILYNKHALITTVQVRLVVVAPVQKKLYDDKNCETL